MSFFALSGLLIGITSFGMAIFMFWRGRQGFQTLWGIVCLSVMIWGFGGYKVGMANEPFEAMIWWRVAYIGVIFIPIVFTHFVFRFLKIENSRGRKIFIRSIYLAGFFFLVMNLTTNFFMPVGHIKFLFNRIYYFNPPTPLYVLYTLMFVGLIIYSHLKLWQGLKNAQGLERLQIKYFFIATFLGFGGGLTAFLPHYNIQLYPYLNVLVVLHPLIMGYAILRYSLMDIKFAIKRSTVFTFLVIIITTIYSFVIFISSTYLQRFTDLDPIFFTGIITSVLVALGFEPVKNFLKISTERIFFKNDYNPQQFLAEINESLSSTLELKKIVGGIAKIFQKIFHLERIAVVILDKKSGYYRVENLSNFKSFNSLSFYQDHPLISYLKKNKLAILITEELIFKYSDLSSKDLIRLYHSIKDLDVAVYLPLFYQEELIGLILLSNKKSGDVYTREEVDILKIVSQSVAIAVENASLYREVKDFNIILSEEVRLATENLRQANMEMSQKNQYLIALQSLTSNITRTLNEKEVLQNISDGIVNYFGYLGGLVLIANEKDKSISLASISHTKDLIKAISILPQNAFEYKGDLDKTDSLSKKAIATGTIQVSERLSDFISPAVPINYADQIQQIVKVKSVVAVPIFSEKRIVGVIDFLLSKKKDSIKSVELEVMQALANEAGIVFKNLQLYDKLQKLNEKLSQANFKLKELDKVKSEFISIASHQLRTPLTVVKGYVSMLLELAFGKISLKERDALEKVYESNERLIKLVEDLLDISRIESGRMQFNFEKSSVQELVTGVYEELKNKAKEKGLKFEIEIDKNVPQITIDKFKLHEVIVNIIDNSIKYTPTGKVNIFVTQKNNNVICSVKDTGIGIEKKDMDTLFKKFSRIQGLTTMGIMGTGLGLYVAKKIIEAHQGKIMVESEGTNKGSTFMILLPIVSKL